MHHPARRRSQRRASAANTVVFVCAASAGIHAGLVPEHLREEPRLGVAFVVTVLVLLAVAAAVALAAARRESARVAAVVLGGLIAAYVATRTTGIPLLSPDREAVDPVGIAACSIELLGLLCAVWLSQTSARHGERPIPQEVLNERQFASGSALDAHARGADRARQHDRRARRFWHA